MWKMGNLHLRSGGPGDIRHGCNSASGRSYSPMTQTGNRQFQVGAAPAPAPAPAISATAAPALAAIDGRAGDELTAGALCYLAHCYSPRCYIRYYIRLSQLRVHPLLCPLVADLVQSQAATLIQSPAATLVQSQAATLVQSQAAPVNPG
eukprot:gene6990-60_t